MSVVEDRLRRKLAQRDRRIAGLQRMNEKLSVRLALTHTFEADIERAIQRALCNVRMVPILGIRSNDKIVEIRNAEEKT